MQTTETATATPARRGKKGSFSDDRVREARRLLRDGATIDEVAARLGASRNIIYSIATRQCYRHVPDDGDPAPGATPPARKAARHAAREAPRYACSRPGCLEPSDGPTPLEFRGPSRATRQVYLCRGCRRELAEFRRTLSPPMAAEQVADAIGEFARTTPGAYATLHTDAEIDAVFSRITGTAR